MISNKENDIHPLSGLYKKKSLPERLFLIGFMGSGKSTVASVLSQLTGYQCVEMDAIIEEQEGMPIRDIFIKRGEHHFRNQESRLLDQLCKQSEIIVSCGGGIIHDDINIAQLKQFGPAVFLQGDPKVLFDRVKHDPNRPFAFLDMQDEQKRFDKFSALYENRIPHYKEASALCIDIKGKTPEVIALEILALL
jgi:shikimate kinase